MGVQENTLPSAPCGLEQDRAGTGPWRQVGPHLINVLLVEDDDVDGLLTKRHLERAFGERLSVTWAQTCREAQALLAPNHFDFAVVDYRLPDGSGVEVIKAARAQGWTAPLFLLTGHLQQEFDLEAMEAGASGCLIKGQTGVIELERTLRYALDQTFERERLQQQVRSLQLLNLELTLAKQEADRKTGGDDGESALSEQALNDQQQQFIAMVSHEFRTPLALIDVLMQRLERDKTEIAPDEIGEIAAKVRNRIAGLTELLASSYQASRSLDGEVELCARQVDLLALLTLVCDNHRAVSNHPVDLTIESLPDRALLDSVLIEHILNNLISNAEKYSPDGAPISVRAVHQDGEVRIHVKDQGLGIPPAEQSRVFEKYFRASTSRGLPGTGIGLWISNLFAVLHRGVITLESEEAVGSTFTLALPARLEDGRAISPAA